MTFAKKCWAWAPKPPLPRFTVGALTPMHQEGNLSVLRLTRDTLPETRDALPASRLRVLEIEISGSSSPESITGKDSLLEETCMCHVKGPKRSSCH